MASDILDSVGDQRRRAYVLASLGVTEFAEPDQLARATDSIDEGISIARSIGDAALLVEVVNIGGEFARWSSDDATARQRYQEAADLAERTGDLTQLSIQLANLSYLEAHTGDYAEARRIGRRALAMCAGRGRRMLAAWSVGELSGPAAGLGEHELAARLIGCSESALEQLGGRRYPSDTPEHVRVVAEVVVALGCHRYDELDADGGGNPSSDSSP